MPEPSREQGTRPWSGASLVPQAALNALCVRLGVLEDMPALQRIEAEASALFPPGVLPIALTRFTSSEDFASAIDKALLLVAEIGQATSPVGFLLAQTQGESLHIAEMDVAPSMGRRGIGTGLLEHAACLARQHGFRFLTLTTFEHLPWNAPFYAKQGYLQVQAFDEFPHLAAALDQERVIGLSRRVAMVKIAA